MKRQERLLHFVGIGGIGMSGIAEMFLNQGYQISGSDRAENETTLRLKRLGAVIHLGHHPQNLSFQLAGVSGVGDGEGVGLPQVVVVSSAIGGDNPEVLEAKRLRIPVIPRAEMLGELMRGKIGIAVAGSHGKTTTTSMIAAILLEAHLDPTLVIGGKVDALGGNAKLGKGLYVVAEADESDGSFLHLPATYGVVTNVDNDHLDHFLSLAAIEQAFIEFVGKLPFYGLAAVCGDDPGVKRCLSRFTKPFHTYGFSEECDTSARDLNLAPLSSRFTVVHGGKRLGVVELQVLGKHNVLNALAALVIGQQLNLPWEVLVRGLANFSGVKRRFEICWQDTQTQRVLVDDYAHHPTEIVATLAAARQFWSGRIIAVFQPHRYTRTLFCHDGFLSAFSNCDVLLMTDVYAAGEEPIPGVSGEQLALDIAKVAHQGKRVLYSGDLAATHQLIAQQWQSGDLVLCLGAGSITRLAEQLAQGLRQQQQSQAQQKPNDGGKQSLSLPCALAAAEPGASRSSLRKASGLLAGS